MAGQRLGLASLGVAVPAVVAVADLCRSPAQLQQQRWLAKESAGSSGQGRLGDERQGGQRPQQQGVGQAGALAGNGKAVELAEDSQLVVQGQQLIERSTSGGGGEVRSLPAAQCGEDGLAILAKPNAFHRRTSSVRRI